MLRESNYGRVNQSMDSPMMIRRKNKRGHYESVEVARRGNFRPTEEN